MNSAIPDHGQRDGQRRGDTGLETGHRDTETEDLMHDGLHASLTEQIIGCAMEVHRHLGPGSARIDLRIGTVL